jgi:hypothetical protein
MMKIRNPQIEVIRGGAQTESETARPWSIARTCWAPAHQELSASYGAQVRARVILSQKCLTQIEVHVVQPVWIHRAGAYLLNSRIRLFLRPEPVTDGCGDDSSLPVIRL